MRSTSTWIIVAAIMLLLDFYVFQALKTVSQSSSERTKNIIFYSYWSLSIATIISVLLFPKLQLLHSSKFFRNYVFAILVGLLFAKIIAAFFFLLDDIRRVLLWTMQKLFSVTGAQYMPEENGISRSVFLSWLGLGLGSSLFGTLLFGFSNKYNYQIKKLKLSFSNLPNAFIGFKIIHISDIHSGSFNDTKAVQHGVDLILQQQADIILFTGDLVNDRHDEMNEYISIFKQLKAPYGVFSTLGNHDYGDYIQWESKAAKIDNLEKLKQLQHDMGWKLLMNEHVILEKDDAKIALIGIENWSNKARFPKYGKLDEAYKGTEKIPFKI